MGDQKPVSVELELDPPRLPKSMEKGRAGSPLPAECFSGVWIAARPAHAGRALPYSLRLCFEGLEEKFLERGAPAPLSVRLIDDFHVVQSLV